MKRQRTSLQIGVDLVWEGMRRIEYYYRHLPVTPATAALLTQIVILRSLLQLMFGPSKYRTSDGAHRTDLKK